MTLRKVSVNQVIENQIPSFVRDEYPLFVQFLKQYYVSLGSQGKPLDIIENLDSYIDLDVIFNLVDDTNLTSNVNRLSNTFSVSSTKGFPSSYGLLQVDDEIISYETKDETNFYNCVRGFSGITGYKENAVQSDLIFESTSAAEHLTGAKVTNLSLIFLKQFIFKLKKQLAPGFEGREFYQGLNQNLFIKQIKDFYTAKGTDSAFKLLFKAIYGKSVTVIRPSDFTIRSSDADYKITEQLVVKSLVGDPTELQNRTLFQLKDNNYPSISAPVASVERFERGNEVYFKLGVDFDFNKDIDVRGDLIRRFQQHPKTYLSESVAAGSTSLPVDTTIGFPSSGKIRVIIDGSERFISYTSKSYSVFYGCTDVPKLDQAQEISIDSYCYGIGDNGKEIRVLVLGVLSDLTIVRPNNYFRKGSRIKLSSVGRVTDDIRSSNWIFNVPTSYDVSRLTLEVNPGGQYKAITSIDHNIVLGDMVELIGSDGVTRSGSVVQVATKNSLNLVTADSVNLSAFYKVRKKLAKAKTSAFPDSTSFLANVQNVYTSFDDDLYITSSSIANYNQQQLNVSNFEINFDINIDNVDEKTINNPPAEYIAYIDAIQTINVANHGYLTGDEVVYHPQSSVNALNIERGIYYVLKIDDDNLKLARSRDNLYQVEAEKESGSTDFDIAKKSASFLVSFTQSATNGTLFPFKFANTKLDKLQLESQRLVRLIKDPTFDQKVVETEPGQTGILLNGVEITNYKSNDAIFYGELTKVDVSDGGSGYDIINPPELIINDSVGSGATGNCSIIGGLESIEIVDLGSDFTTAPIINITGGNGTGASAEPNLQELEYTEDFDASSALGAVDLVNNRIKFIKNHKFKTGERVVYDNQLETILGGLIGESEYYLNVFDSDEISLHNTYSDAINGINEVNITSYGTGVQRIKSTTKKKFLTSINIINSGEGYCNNKVVVNNSGINSTTDQINFVNHGFSSGEIVDYFPGNGSQIVGLSTIQKSYYVTAIDEDNFKLSEIGNSGIGSEYYYTTKQYVNLGDATGNNHTFNYPPIKVSVTGLVGLSTQTSQNFNVEVQPRFTGSINKINLAHKGSDYGSKTILNYLRQPEISVQTGSGAQLTPIISSDGIIVDALISSKGSNYSSPPRITVSGTGRGAILTAIIVNGQLESVSVVSGGRGYTPNETFLTVETPGNGALLESSIQKWTINEVERLINSSRVRNDDSFPTLSYSRKYGIEYSHLYASRAYREIVQGSLIDNTGKTIYRSDIDNDTESDPENLYHSPIIGWAYDGNPIYGPYGFSGVDTPGNIIQVKSGYVLDVSSTRPSGFLPGYFVEDYKFVGTKDDDNTFLDEYNGRYCVTPEYPNGVYAYFATINDVLDSSSFFQNEKRPVFPYLIGNSYKSVPIEFNFDALSEQSTFDISEYNVFRNTKTYGEEEEAASYDFYTNPIRIREQVNKIKAIQSSNVESMLFVSRGDGYKVNDSILYSDEDKINTSSAIINKVKGKTISTITSSIDEIKDVYFFPLPGSLSNFVGLTSTPHNFTSGDVVEIKDLKNANSFIDGKYDITILGRDLILRENIGAISATGLTTHFDIYATDYRLVLPGDVYKVGEETVRILNVDKSSNRIRVERNIDPFVGMTEEHYPLEPLIEQPRKFVINVTSNDTIRPDTTLFFNPVDTLGLGNTFGPGITSTIYFSTPGIGATFVEVPTRGLYFPNHGLKTGEVLNYNTFGGDSVQVGINSTSSFNLTDISEIYVVKFTRDVIGISSNRIGLGSDGTYVGVGTISNDILFLTGIGTGEKHRFVSEFEDVLQASVIENKVTIDTETDHSLIIGDQITLSGTSGISTTMQISYDDTLRRMLVNPISITSAGINTTTNAITINGHSIKSGQKVVYKSSTPSVGLENGKIYYTIVLNSDEIQLSENYYNSTIKKPIAVDIDSQQNAELFFVNPPLTIFRDQKVIFDISDPSLAFGGIDCFELKIFSDPFFKDEYRKSETSDEFDTETIGSIGQPGAKLELQLNSGSPNILYYNLVPVNNSVIPSAKINILTDENDIDNNNTLIVKSSGYNGTHNITGITSTSFSFVISNTPEESEYIKSNSQFEYLTSSSNVSGPIGTVEISQSNQSFSRLPKVNSIVSVGGTGAIAVPQSTTIGALKKGSSIEILDIGFDYSSDKTLRPVAFLPSLIRVEALSSFESIDVTNAGIGYNEKPELVVLDGFTGKLVDDVELSYTDEGVDIKKNTKGLYGVTPTIIPVKNTNGAGISTVTYDVVTRDVTVTLSNAYSNLSDFPFEIGDKIIVENVTVSTDPDEVFSQGNSGFNSSDYGYKLFTVKNRDPKIGGNNPTITYSLKDLDIGTGPGVYNSAINIGRVVPQKYFPVFDITLKKNTFFFDEKISSTTTKNVGIVEYWDKNNEYLSIFTNSKFLKGEVIFGESSGSIATIESIIQSLAYYDIEASAVVPTGFNDEVGFLNERTQRIHDNEYYQYFSYALNSQVAYENWNPLVSDLNHTVGFRKFSDLVIESSEFESGISTVQTENKINVINDLVSVIDLETTSDFDLAAEVSFEINNQLVSNEIVFNSMLLQDFSECIGNRVLNIDDISGDFNDSAVQTVITQFPL